VNLLLSLQLLLEFIQAYALIDAATARPEESILTIDWEGKVALVQTAQALEIKKYIYFSIINCDKYQAVPLMNIKACIEDFIKITGIDYTIFRLCGFMQAVIRGYAEPILDQRPVRDENKRIAYLDTQDIAMMTLAALKRPETARQTLTLRGPKAWKTEEIIKLCENFSEGSKATVTKEPLWVIRATREILSKLEWANDAADRLAFADVVTEEEISATELDKTYKILGVNPSEVLSLDQYIKEYYDITIKKLKEIGAESRQTDYFI